jgi:regulatory protein
LKRPARPITAKYLQNAATFYLERYPSTAEGLRRVLNRRVRKAEMLEAPVMDNVKQAIEAIVAKFVDAGVIDDKAFAQTKARSLHRRGTSSRLTRARPRRNRTPLSCAKSPLIMPGWRASKSKTID